MIKKTFSMGVLVAISLLSCSKTQKVSDVAPAEPINTLEKDNQIVYDTLVGNAGEKLYCVFDNKKDVATLKFKDETIVLKSDSMASGVGYSNANYNYNEWHGKISLKKDGKEIFSQGKEKMP